jgi:hypothetical protein
MSMPTTLSPPRCPGFRTLHLARPFFLDSPDREAPRDGKAPALTRRLCLPGLSGRSARLSSAAVSTFLLQTDSRLAFRKNAWCASDSRTHDLGEALVVDDTWLDLARGGHFENLIHLIVLPVSIRRDRNTHRKARQSHANLDDEDNIEGTRLASDSSRVWQRAGAPAPSTH